MSANTAAHRKEVPATIMGPRIVFLLTVLALVLLGLVMVYSASFVEAINDNDSAESYLLKQIIGVVAGFVAVVVLWKILPLRVWRTSWVYVPWAVCLALLLAVWLSGASEGGAQRWLIIGPISIQPSEFAKVAVVMTMAHILMEFRNRDFDAKSLALRIAALIILPVGLIYQTQSDLGTTLICAVGVIAVLWFGKVPFKVIFAIIAVGVVFAIYAVVGTGYRSDRFTYLDPWNDGQGGYGTGYQTIHAFYAFAEGGLFGVGLGNSREKYLYLPEAETDFIFAVIGEELGMVGALVVILLFLLFLWSGMMIARNATDSFGSMIAGSCVAMIAFQAFLNIGCVVGLFPTTGKPLPFISSGVSSVFATLIMVGLVLSVSREAERASDVYNQRRADLRVVQAEESSRRIR